MRLASDARAGALAVAPMLLGAIPFGLVAGAAPVSEGLGGWSAVGLSTLVFAGASQLAIVDVLGGGGSALVAVLAAWTINLRMVLYSASLAPFLGAEPRRRRFLAAYLLTDQVYALSISRWSKGGDGEGRLVYYLTAGWVLWVAWQASTALGVMIGGAVPDDVPLDFAVPLVFLVMLVPVLSSRPALVAAAAGGVGAVGAAQAGAGPLSVMVGAIAGIIAGTVADLFAGAGGGPMNRTWIAIVASGAGTFAMRASFLAFAHRLVVVPPGVARALRQIPPAALAAIVAPALVRGDGHLHLLQPRLAAGFVAALVAWRTRNVGLTLAAGMGMLMVLQAL